MNPLEVIVRVDDLTSVQTRALIARHLRGMYESSPPESVHAFDIDKLRDPDVRFWSAWVGEKIAGCGALKQLEETRGEIKSMRVADEFLGRGIGRILLQHIEKEAKAMGMTSLWLETGSTPSFVPATKLYESAGYQYCGPFANYVDDPFSRFMTKAI